MFSHKQRILRRQFYKPADDDRERVANYLKKRLTKWIKRRKLGRSALPYQLVFAYPTSFLLNHFENIQRINDLVTFYFLFFNGRHLFILSTHLTVL